MRTRVAGWLGLTIVGSEFIGSPAQLVAGLGPIVLVVEFELDSSRVSDGGSALITFLNNVKWNLSRPDPTNLELLSHKCPPEARPDNHYCRVQARLGLGIDNSSAWN